MGQQDAPQVARLFFGRLLFSYHVGLASTASFSPEPLLPCRNTFSEDQTIRADLFDRLARVKKFEECSDLIATEHWLLEISDMSPTFSTHDSCSRLTVDSGYLAKPDSIEKQNLCVG